MNYISCRFVSVMTVAVRRSSTLSPVNLALAEGLLNGNRASLAKSITLIESSRNDHQIQADLLLGHLAETEKTKSAAKRRFQCGKTLRLGFAGPPGGKSLVPINSLCS